MRATLWIAASGFLLASGSAYAGPGLPIGQDDTVYPDDLGEASSLRRPDVTITDQGPQPRDIASSAKARKGARQTAAHDLSKTQPAEACPQEKAGARSYAVTVDPERPGGEFPWGG